MKQKVLAVVMTLTLAVSLTACTFSSSTDNSAGSADTTAAAEDEGDSDQTGNGSKGTILFSTKTITNNEFQRIMVEKCQEVVEAAGYTFELTLSGDEQLLWMEVP